MLTIRAASFISSHICHHSIKILDRTDDLNEIDIVIARYNENIKWISKLNKEKFNIIIYNKGGDLIENSIKLDNIGREAHTYIYHIVNNYNNIKDTVFLQGDPFSHCKKLLSKLDNLEENFIALSDNIYTEIIREWHDAIQYIIDGKVQREITFNTGAQFFVKKESIHNREIKFYLDILNGFNNNSKLPWQLERVWRYIFEV